jgi:predicted nuclease of predicted toxin-antitoxin system
VRIEANENFPKETVEALRARGHDVRWARTESPDASDVQILQRAEADGCLLITFDKDFGELAFRYRLPATCGIVLFRIPMNSPSEVTRVAVATLESREDWQGHFSVIGEGRIRMTPLPPTEGTRPESRQ